MATIEEQLPELEKHIGELVLISCHEGPMLFNGCFLEKDDILEDYYYHLIDFSGKYHSMSAVGWIIFLKGKIEDKAYEYLVHQWNLNFKLRYEETIAK